MTIHKGTIVQWRCTCGHTYIRRRGWVTVDFINDRERVVDRLADFIEQQVPGAQVYRDTGLVVT